VAVTLGGPAPGKLQWVRPDAFAAGLCSPVRLELRDTFNGGLARAVRTVHLAINGGTNAQLFAADCSGSPLSAVTVPRDAAYVLLALKPTAAASVSVQAVDLGGDLHTAQATWAVP
jgi:hypothetical protein